VPSQFRGRGPGLVAIIALLGLLLAFHHVVRGSVERGDLWRKSVAEHADATWRCQLLADPELRQACRARLGRAP
jgi:hypothetical protein